MPPRRNKLLLAQTSFLGDVVLTTPLWRALRDGLPGTELWWLVRPDAAALIAPLAGPGRVLVFDKRGGDGGLGGMRAVAERLRGHGFDAAIAVQRSLRTAVTLALAGIPERIGFAGAPGALLYHHRVAHRGAHARDRLLALGAPLIATRPPPSPELVADEIATASLAAKLVEAGVGAHEQLLVLAPGAAWETKRWPAERFAELACGLVPDSLARVVVVGTATDRPHAAVVAARLARLRPGAPPIVDLTGRTTTAELVAALARARLVVANDSAPAHIAAALGRPVLALFGPTVPAQGFAPLGPRVRILERSLGCRPCSRHGGAWCPIGTHECLTDLPAGHVVAAAREQLARDAHAAPVGSAPGASA